MYNDMYRHKTETDSYRKLFDSLKDIKDESEYIHKLTELIKRIFEERTSFVSNSDNNEVRDRFFELLEFRLFKLYAFNGCKGMPKDNIEFIGSGHTSLAFRVGSEVIKIGKTNYDRNRNKKLNYDCLIPRSVNESYQVDGREYYTIDVSPPVDIEEISEEELYQVYKRLRTEGYIWNDARPDNVGRLREDFDLDGIQYKKGELVIIDLEDIAYVGETTSDTILEEIAIASYNSRTYGFETRYLNEKGSAKKNVMKTG